MLRSTLRDCYARLIRLSPLAGGQSILSFNRFTNWLYQGVAAPQSARLRSGHVVAVDPHDYHGRALLLFGTGDIKVGELVQTLLDPGDVFIDIGANYGSIGLLATNIVGMTGAVHFVEPQPNLHERLAEAIKTGPRHAPAQVHPFALSNRTGLLMIHCADSHTGLATLEPGKLADRLSRSFEVPVVDIERFLIHNASERPTGIKIDVEGHELVLLPSILARPNVKFVVFEACNNTDELYHLIDTADYEIYGVCRLRFFRRLRRVHSARDLALYHDAVALPRRTLRARPEYCNFRALAGSLGA